MSKIISLVHAGNAAVVRRVGFLTYLAWFIVEATIINNRLMPVSAVRVFLLRLFGAKIGRGCLVRQAIRVKFPWNLEMGDDCWIGEDVWLHNQDSLKIGSNVCLSQGTFITTGSHDAVNTMDLLIAPVIIEDGVWITAKCVVQKGVTIGCSALVTPLSVVHKSLDSEGVYGGNPCRFIRKRFPQ